MKIFKFENQIRGWGQIDYVLIIADSVKNAQLILATTNFEENVEWILIEITEIKKENVILDIIYMSE